MNRITYGTADDGSRNTIHASEMLNIEVDDDGHPTAVWFRCLTLPFNVWRRESGDPAHCNPNIRVMSIDYETGD